eukprot:jgi/Botrbrau1/15502/Bobra.43_2s0119.1
MGQPCLLGHQDLGLEVMDSEQVDRPCAAYGQVERIGSTDIFAIEEAEGDGPCTSEQQKLLIRSFDFVDDVIQGLMEPDSPFQQQLARSARHFMEKVLKDEGTSDIALVAMYLSKAGYRVAIRTAKGGGSGRTCFDNLRHHHILVFPNDSTRSEDAYIVDISFRDQFRMRRATPLYSAVLEAVPHPFVGNRRQLLEMLKVLSDQMAKAFQENDEACPPWRRYCALVSKWLPKESKKEEFIIEEGDGSTSIEARCLGGSSQEGACSRTEAALSRKSSSASSFKTRRPCCCVSPDSVLAQLAPCAMCANLPMVNLSGFELGHPLKETQAAPPHDSAAARTVACARADFPRYKNPSAHRSISERDQAPREDNLAPPAYATDSILSHAMGELLPVHLRKIGKAATLAGPVVGGKSVPHSNPGAFHMLRVVGRLQREMLNRDRASFARV